MMLTIVGFVFLLTPVSFAAISGSGRSTIPQILLPPEDTFPVNGNLEFSCKGTGFPDPQITWYDANTRRPLKESTANVHMKQYLDRLTILQPEPKQVYAVYCNISNAAGWTASDVVRGGLAYLEYDFPRFPIDTSAVEGDLVLLECHPPLGNPPPTTEWLFNGVELPRELGQVSPEGDLHIQKVKLRNSGTYACRARNPSGVRTSPSAVVTVKRKAPRFIQKPKDVHASVGSTVQFFCRTADSGPVTWRKDTAETAVDPSRVQISSNSIIIHNVQLSDAGRYICVAEDGESTADARLTVSNAQKPTFSRTPVDRNATEGETVVFHCQASGSHEISTYWDLPMGNVFVNEHGDLQIRNVSLSDSGVYQCIANSNFGLISAQAELRVLPRATKDVIPLPPIINLPPANQTRVTGDTVILDCEVGITREPETGHDLTVRGFDGTQSRVFWVRGTRSAGGLQERIDLVSRDRDPRFSLLPGGGLQIVGAMVEDTGNYTCFVQTGRGHFMQSNWTAYLVVLPSGTHPSLSTEPTDPLSPPEDLRVQNQTAKSLTLIWNPPDSHDSSQVSYWIEMFHSTEPELGWQVLQESWHRNAIRLEPLEPNSAYYFLIRPRWIDGRIGWASAPLGPIEMQHRPQSATGPGLVKVLGTRVQVVSPTSVRVTWNLENPRKAAAVINGFSVRYKEVPMTRCISTSLHDSNFCSLRPGEPLPQLLQNYQQQLNAASLRDTQGVSLVPHEEPEIFVDVPVHRNQGSASPWTTELTNLKPFRCYHLLVQPYSTYSRQSADGAVVFLTQEEAPSTPPQIVGVKRKTNHSVEVSWTAPPAHSWNGLLTGFIVYAFNAAENDKRELKFGHHDTKGVVGGLKSGEIYHIQMAAVNCRGSSSKGIPVNFSVSDGGVIHDSAQPSDGGTLIQFQPWVVGCIAGVLIIWLVAVFIAVLFCVRQRNQPKHRYPPNSGGGSFNENGGRKCSTAGASKEAYQLGPLIKPNSMSGGVSELDCPRGSDSMLKAPTTSTQHNTTTTIASSNSSSTGGSCNPNCGHIQHPFEEGVPGHSSDFSNSPFFGHMPAQHMEYPFVDYRPVDGPNNNVFSTSVIESNPTATGLPLVAPVAQLARPCGNGSGAEHVSSSVTPYATASLINAELLQKASGVSPGSRTPSDMSSNAGGSHLSARGMNSPQRFPSRPQQYLSRSSSGTTTGAEEDYLAQHNHQQQQQQQQSRRLVQTSNLAPLTPQIPPTFAEYELCLPAVPQHASALHNQHHQFPLQAPTNGGIHTPAF
ncbi:unnamed protein product [Mesocestoides corti]|uniref:Uncharacterized protein n=1 Tax=Mesocestoides corti TaxID=53468 RepID=A0A0R3U7X5_MESCO|nr:unnamed protein product [Mesocestoides corti]